MLTAQHYLRYGQASESTAPVFEPDPDPDPGGGGGGSTLTQVQPMAAGSIDVGVCAHPNSLQSVYQLSNQTVWADFAESLNVGYIRGLMNPSNAGCAAIVPKLRARGLKMGMLVVEEGGAAGQISGTSIAEVNSRIQWIADNAADVCLFIEGPNEPNHVRGGTGADIPNNWASQVTPYQQAIWNKVGSTGLRAQGVKVLSASLHDTEAYQSYTEANPDGGARHWHQMANQNQDNYFDYVGIHRYPGGWEPLRAMQSRLTELYSAFGANIPIWVTETGYHDAINTTAGHNPVSQARWAQYVKRMIMQFTIGLSRNAIRSDFPITLYELLDDPNSGRTEHEFNFGYMETPTLTGTGGWSEKTPAQAVREFLALLEDPGDNGNYTPPTVGVEVTGGPADMQWEVVGYSNGTARILLTRTATIWNATARSDISSALTSTNATVTDDAGSRTVSVGPNVTSLLLR